MYNIIQCKIYLSRSGIIDAMARYRAAARRLRNTEVEVSATSRLPVQRSPTECGAQLWVIKEPRERGGYSPRWAAEPQEAITRAGLQSQRK
jgi:hypothetical protein